MAALRYLRQVNEYAFAPPGLEPGPIRSDRRLPGDTKNKRSGQPILQRKLKEGGKHSTQEVRVDVPAGIQLNKSTPQSAERLSRRIAGETRASGRLDEGR
jgi:hypothetical protein